MYAIIVGSIIVFCIALSIGGGALFFVAIANFLWLLVTGQWDPKPREYGNHMLDNWP